MKTLLCLCCVFFEAISYPYNGYRYSPYSPQRTVMFGGYYGNPFDTRSSAPQGSVSFGAGDTIATNAFAGEQYPEFGASAEETTRNKSTINLEDEEAEVTEKPRRQKPSKKDEDEEDLPSSWPFGNGRNGPSYTAFFPIMFGGSGGSRSRSADEGYYPGPATAIANSFSTGKGGVATSHATAFGDPSLSALFRNGSFNRRLKPSQEEN